MRLLVQGRVQGVGFRPFISHLANSLGLKGYVQNIQEGVEIVVIGEACEIFIQELQSKLPANAQIQNLYFLPSLHDALEFDDFKIRESQIEGKSFIQPIPDLATCGACRDEIQNPKARRYFYPLINCTHCGPRFSIIQAFPYDRERTSMQIFKPCEDCQTQYSQIQDRFFHAQPISCPSCSPKLYWMNEERRDYPRLFEEMAALIQAGEILCIQGIGGFHLVCSAKHKQAISRLRKLKDRPTKALALLCKDLQMAEQIAYINTIEAKHLQSKEAPIVLLQKKQELEGIAKDCYGVMLAYTPTYHLLFEFLQDPLVVTSANLKSQPILYQSHQIPALGIPYVLRHEREIIQPIEEDSVIQILSTQDIVVLRNARGYAPQAWNLPHKLDKPFLALGANQKAHFALAFGDLLILSPYIGELSELASIERFKASIQHFQKLYGLEFGEIACDLHPQYQSTQIAQEMRLPLTQIQHHYAHTLSVCFEHGLREKVLSFCFDGTGYGSDGKIWGGEVLLADPLSFTRLLHFHYFPLLGSEVAMKDIGRNFFSLLYSLSHPQDLSWEQLQSFFLSRGYSQTELATLKTMADKGLNSPQTSSVGRIFDAIAWLCGLEKQSYEAESGEWLSSLYDSKIKDSYTFEINNQEIVLDYFAIYSDAKAKISASKIASKFLNTLTALILHIAELYSYEIVLCGGVFCNRILSAKLLEHFRARGRKCYIGRRIPPNDNGIAIGQIYHLIQRSQYANKSAAQKEY